MSPKEARAVRASIPPLPCALLLGLFAAAGTAQALTLRFPGPTTTATRSEPLASFRLPIGPYTADGMQTRLTEGALDQTAWRITAPDLTTLGLMKPLRDQIAADGWSVIYECETAACGGYDFRYGTDVMTEPDMHVDLGDFRYLAAERTSPQGPESLALLVSRSATSGFVQLTLIGAAPAPPVTQALPTPITATPTPATGIGQQIETRGTVALDDLIFPSGTATLAPGDYASLADIAAYLRANPDKTIALVGHTDASGSLDANIALSRKRAQAVRQRLIDTYDLPAAQIAADGAGYLAPRASNLTPEGRTQNRRVEVMLTSTQ